MRDFDTAFPLPYRIAFQVLLGVWGWGLNCYLLWSSHVDLPYLFKFQTHGQEPIHTHVFNIATHLSFFYVGSLFLFSILHFDESHERAAGDLLPWLTLIAIFTYLMLPGRHGGRSRFSWTLSRVLRGGIDADYRLGDVLVTDVLTSYTKVFVDLGISACIALSGGSCLSAPHRECGGEFLVPLISYYPFLLRLIQCLTDYSRTGHNSHLFNCLKYASSIPVITLSAMKRVFPGEEEEGGWLSQSSLEYLWLEALFLNSLYSFVWDVKMDWNLTMMDFKNISYGGLRRVIYFKKPWYYVAIILDYLLRFTWSLKLSPHWYHFGDLETGLFILESMEILRRCMWITFRIEAEWVKGLKDVDESLELARMDPIPHDHLKD